MSTAVPAGTGVILGGRYQLVREIGAGGMGRVFQAIDNETGRAVAAKVLLPNDDDHLEALLRFYQEGAVLSTLKHPSIVEVIGTFLEDDTCCIVMEMLDGESLGDLLNSGPLPLERSKWLIRQVASALAYAHSRGVIHRDVKPDNIMVVGEDTAKVMDFGIARILRNSTWNTVDGLSLGTPLYMAPEQIEGKQLDGRTDVYSLGAVMYEMVTGSPPFHGDDPLIIAYKHVHEPPRRPSDVNPDVPADWDDLVMRALSKNPAERFQTMIAFEARASNLSLGEPIGPRVPTARPPSPEPRVPTYRLPTMQPGGRPDPAEEHASQPATGPTGQSGPSRPSARENDKAASPVNGAGQEPTAEAAPTGHRPRTWRALLATGATLILLVVAGFMYRTGETQTLTQYQVPRGGVPAEMPSSYLDSATAVQVSVDGAMTVTGHHNGTGPKRGLLWEFVHVEVHNTGLRGASYNPFDFKLLDNQGDSFLPGLSRSDLPALDSGRIGPGEIVAGWLGFRLPVDVGTSTLAWSDGNRLAPPIGVVGIPIKG